ncbi:hypothetical protein [Deinococcus sp.]|uniref:hypothetical protein n=1 Tax=Deinococcus sp. TaxID=47478 RepID=UPI003B5C4557
MIQLANVVFEILSEKADGLRPGGFLAAFTLFIWLQGKRPKCLAQKRKSPRYTNALQRKNPTCRSGVLCVWFGGDIRIRTEDILLANWPIGCKRVIIQGHAPPHFCLPERHFMAFAHPLHMLWITDVRGPVGHGLVTVGHEPVAVSSLWKRP